MSFHLGPLSRRERMWLGLGCGCLAAGLLIGPAFLALAECPPLRAATGWTPPRLVPVGAFPDLGAEGCFYDLPVFGGPTSVRGTVIGRSDLERRVRAAVFACARDDWTGDVTISAAVDAAGNITDVISHGNVSPVMRSCLTLKVLEGDPIATRGPGTLRTSYFIGRRSTTYRSSRAVQPSADVPTGGEAG
ncbi:MAG TPA: hypothetical protein VHO67_08525 [Polyangia bacterium]|nr:hypothetical protein [Polyangia bacterium]